jgi:hypothetical protein
VPANMPSRAASTIALLPSMLVPLILCIIGYDGAALIEQQP